MAQPLAVVEARAGFGLFGEPGDFRGREANPGGEHQNVVVHVPGRSAHPLAIRLDPLHPRLQESQAAGGERAVAARHALPGFAAEQIIERRGAEHETLGGLDERDPGARHELLEGEGKRDAGDPCAGDHHAPGARIAGGCPERAPDRERQAREQSEEMPPLHRHEKTNAKTPRRALKRP